MAPLLRAACSLSMTVPTDWRLDDASTKTLLTRCDVWSLIPLAAKGFETTSTVAGQLATIVPCWRLLAHYLGI
eukprot:3771315-Pyramimonas_sp.AAC.1